MRKLVLLWMGVWVCSSVALGAFDFTISDTYDGGTVTLNSESLLVAGAGAHEIRARGHSYVEVQDTAPLELGTGGIYGLVLYDTSQMTFLGGELGDLVIRGDATATLSGGRIDYIASYQYVPMPNDIAYPRIEMVVRSWSHNDQTNLLTGSWNVDNDNDSEFDTFSMQLHDQAGYDPVLENITFTIIPEPMTLLFFGLGGLAVRGFRKRS